MGGSGVEDGWSLNSEAWRCTVVESVLNRNTLFSRVKAVSVPISVHALVTGVRNFDLLSWMTGCSFNHDSVMWKATSTAGHWISAIKLPWFVRNVLDVLDLAT